jgi:hypothetical protein
MSPQFVCRGEIHWRWHLSKTSKTSAAAVLFLTFVAFGDGFGDLGLLLLVAALVVAWRSTPGFWRVVVGGVVGGAVAGLLILGPGFRMAMRVVALMDPTLAEEFSIAGTVFIVVGIGAIMGGAQAAVFQLARRAFGIESAVWSGALLGSTLMVDLTFFAGELSDELFELGAGAWVNIPLFGVIAIAFGIAAMAVADRAESVMFRRKARVREEVRA